MAIIVKEVRVVVSTAGTAVQLSSPDLKVPAFTVTADPSNSGTIYIGSDSVDASGVVGQPIAANESIEFEPPAYFGTNELFNLADFYADSTANGDAVIVTWYARKGN